MLNKSGGSAALSTALVVSGTVTFTKGTLTTTSSNLLTINSGGTVSGASDSSFIDGPVKKIGNSAFPVKKIGNSAFVFPVGKGNKLFPLSISAPSNSTEAYTVESFDTSAHPNAARESSLSYVTKSYYWSVTRNSGSTDVYVSLGWSRFFSQLDSSKLRIARWSGSQWLDLGNGSVTGNNAVGSVRSQNTLSSFGTFTQFWYIYSCRSS